jgi:hypothetical protein
MSWWTALVSRAPVPTTHNPLPATSNPLHATRNLQPDPCYLLPATQATCSLLPATFYPGCNLVPSTCYLLPATSLPPATHYMPPATCNLLSATCYLLPRQSATCYRCTCYLLPRLQPSTCYLLPATSLLPVTRYGSVSYLLPATCYPAVWSLFTNDSTAIYERHKLTD